MTETVNRYCPNPECPTVEATGKPRYLGESDGAVRLKCHSCKTWWAWNADGELEEEGTLMLEDLAC